jgi:excisionase family DNA binding protein
VVGRGEASLSDSLLRVEEVCDLLQVGPTFVYRHAAELGGVKVGRHLRFRKRDIDAWLDGRRVEETAEGWRRPSLKS